MKKQDKIENNSSQKDHGNGDPHAFEKQYSLEKLKAVSVYDDLIYKIGAGKSGAWNIDSLKNYINTVYLLYLYQIKLKDIDNYVIFNTGLYMLQDEPKVVYCIAKSDEKSGKYKFLSFSTEDEIMENYNIAFDSKELPLPKDIVLKNKANHKELKLPDEKTMVTIDDVKKRFGKNKKISTEASNSNDGSGWFHIIIDGCDNLPHSLFRYIIDYTAEKENCNAYPNLLFKVNNSNHKSLQILQEKVDNGIENNDNDELKNKLKEEQCNIILLRCKTIKERIEKAYEQSINNKEVIAPFYYRVKKTINYALPLYIGHDTKPDCVIVFGEDKVAKTLLNMHEIRKDLRILGTDVILDIPWLIE